MRRGIAGAGVALLLGSGVTACAKEPVDCAPRGSGHLDVSRAAGCTPPKRSVPPPAPPATRGSVAAALPVAADMAGLGVPEKPRSWTRSGSEPAVCGEVRSVCASLTAYGVSAYESADGRTEARFEVYGYPSRSAARTAQPDLAEHKVEVGGGARDVPSGAEWSRGVELGTPRAPEGHGLVFQYRSYVVWMTYTTKTRPQTTEAIEKMSALQLGRIDKAAQKTGEPSAGT